MTNASRRRLRGAITKGRACNPCYRKKNGKSNIMIINTTFHSFNYLLRLVLALSTCCRASEVTSVTWRSEIKRKKFWQSQKKNDLKSAEIFLQLFWIYLTGDLLPCLHLLIIFHFVCHWLLEIATSSAWRMSAGAPNMERGMKNKEISTTVAELPVLFSLAIKFTV